MLKKAKQLRSTSYSIEGLTEHFCCSKGNNLTNLKDTSIRGSSSVTKAAFVTEEDPQIETFFEIG